MPAAWVSAGVAVYGALNADGSSSGGGGGGSSGPTNAESLEQIRAQGVENRSTFRDQLNASRTSTTNPMGTSRWQNNATFDQAGYDAAMARHTASLAAPVAQAAQAPLDFNMGGSTNDEVNSQIGLPNAGGGYERMRGQYFISGAEPATSVAPPTPSAAPDRASFQGPDAWENIQAFNPVEQGIFDDTTKKYGEAVNGISTNADNYNSSVADAVYRRSRRYQDAADTQARSSQQANLADRGFAIGNEATNAERTRLDDSINRGIADSADRAQITGFTQGQAQLTMQQRIAQTLAGLRTGQMNGITGMPSTTTTPSLNNVDIAGIMQNGQTNAQNAQNARDASNENMMHSLRPALNQGFDRFNRGRNNGGFYDSGSRTTPLTFGDGEY